MKRGGKQLPKVYDFPPVFIGFKQVQSFCAVLIILKNAYTKI